MGVGRRAGEAALEAAGERRGGRVAAGALGRAVRAAASLALLGCLGLGRVSLVAPDVSVINAVPVSSTGFETEVRVLLRVSNSNEVPLELDGLRFELELNGQPFARGRSGESLVLPRLGDAQVAVLVRTSAADLLRQLGALGQAGGLQYRISGELFVKQPERRRLSFQSAASFQGEASP